MEDTGRLYMDSSVVLAQLLREQDAFKGSDPKGELVTSELTELECRRTLDRIRLQEGLADEEVADRLAELDILLRALRVVRVSAPILRRAKAPYPTVVRSLDAIHLATAELTKSEVFLTLDKQQAIAAKALGLKAI